jgi:hypothetical protein
MEIRWFGKNSFTLKEGKVRVVIDPNETLLPEVTEDDVVLVTKGSLENFKGKSYDWPGEYETKDVLVYALPTEYGENETRILSFEFGGIRICNLSTIPTPISDTMISELGNVDILIVPMTLKPKDAYGLIEEVDPKMVIVSMQGEPDTTLLADFLKIIEQPGLEAVDKIVIKNKSELDSEQIVYKIMSS